MKLKRNAETNWKFLFILTFAFFFFCGVIFVFSEVIERESDLPGYSLKIEKNHNVPVYLEFFEKVKAGLILEEENFLEVNLEEMKVSLYEKGLFLKDFPILTKGDPQGWGGSAVGIYEVISGGKANFSVVSDVYMPYSLRYYGKYYIHGEPYYKWGEKVVSSVSGGCLRMKDELAKEIYEFVEIGTPVLVIDKKRDVHDYPLKNISDFPDLSAESYLVADLDSGFVFSEKDSQSKLPIASLTKLMTAIVLSEHVDLTKKLTITKNVLETYGHSDVLEEGKEFKLVELFYPLLVESSNDATEAMMYFLGRIGTIDLMNEKAKSILMENTSFEDPSGLSSLNVSTARDLFYLTRYILNNRPTLLKITKGEEVRTFGGLSFDIEEMESKNLFLDNPDCIGGKTGFIKASKYTAICVFRFDVGGEERNIAVILLKSEEDESDGQKVYDWLKENYF
jgi:hypothetical protein